MKGITFGRNSPVCPSTRRTWLTWRSTEASSCCVSLLPVVRFCHDPHGETPSQFRGLDFAWALDLLSALNVASTLQDLSPLKSVGLHKLRGDRKGQWAMTVNARWRICFVFRKGDAYDVEIVDYHKG